MKLKPLQFAIINPLLEACTVLNAPTILSTKYMRDHIYIISLAYGTADIQIAVIILPHSILCKIILCRWIKCPDKGGCLVQRVRTSADKKDRNLITCCRLSTYAISQRAQLFASEIWIYS